MHAIAMSKFSVRRPGWRLLLLALGVVRALAADRPASEGASATASLLPAPGRLVVDVQGVPPPAPVFFSAAAVTTVRFGPTEVTGETRLKLRLIQGRPEVLSFGLSGDGEVIAVSGKQVRDWSVRQEGTGTGTRRFLDLRLAQVVPLVSVAAPAEFELEVRTRLRLPAVPGTMAVLLLTPGDAVGFSAQISLQPDPALDLRVTAATGLTPLGEPLQFHAAGDGRIEVRLTPRGAAAADLELLDAQLAGRVTEAAGSVNFELRGQLRARMPGARLRLLSGGAGLSERTEGDGWRVELVALDAQRFAYDLVALRAGSLPFELRFAAAVREDGDWRAIDFAMPAGAVVPLRLDGLGAAVSFKPDAPVVPTATRDADDAGQASGWRGFLPADGAASLAWRRMREAGESTLAFTSTEQTEVRIGAGLRRQTSQVAFRVLQGRLDGVRFSVEGTGEIVGVEGTHVIGWKVIQDGPGGRVLEVRFSRPAEADTARLTIQSQAELGGWPVRTEPLRLTPEGGVRHSGFLRVANSGAVRLEVADASGIMQLAPAQFPGPAIGDGARQVFVYRFPSAIYGYHVLASPIQPEVSVSAITTYELGETVRLINASVELDVREAALRDWTLRIPADYTVVSLTGGDVADYAAETVAAGGMRALRVLFGRPVEGRQLLQLRLEKSQPASAGEWSLPPLQFPGARSVRGHIGAIATPGFRLAPVRVERLVEVPLSFFPRQTAGLQQAWRLREADWTAEVRVEALGQSVQADVFHLHALKEGAVTTSVLLNYFVIGAPAGEWRIEVPAGIGNLDVIGQNVRRDWRREGDQLIVSLHQPVLGSATLLLTFEQPLSARGGSIEPGLVRPVGVQSERGFIQVVSPRQVKHEIRRAEGALLKLEATELPAEFRLFSSAPSLAVYQYTARPFRLELGVESYAPGETVDQVVDFAKLSSQVSRDGQVVTEATFFVKTRGRKALRLVLPAGTKLWETRVDHELVNARADGDQTLVPLPPRLNPNEPAVVTLRLGQPAPAAGSTVKLLAPRVAGTPTVISEWGVRGDAGWQLVPRSGTAELGRPVLTETGFEWIATRGGLGTFLILALVLVGAGSLRSPSGWRGAVGVIVCTLAVAAAGVMTRAAMMERRPNVTELEFAATMVPTDEAVTLELANVPEWRAMLVTGGLVATVAGGLVLVAAGLASARLSRRRAYVAALAGVGLLVSGLLAQHGGAVMFFALIALVVLGWILVPGMVAWWRSRVKVAPTPLATPGPGGATVASLLLFAGALTLGLGPSDGRAQRAAAARAAQTQPAVAPAVVAPPVVAPTLSDATQPLHALVQRWTIRGERMFAEVEVTVRGSPGDSFLLLRAPAVLTDFKGEGLRIGKLEREGHAAYYLSPEREGTFTARVRFELPLRDRSLPLFLPTGPAALQRVTVELDQGGWEFSSPAAVQVTPASDLAANRSGATLVLAPHAAPSIRLQPRQRDVDAETTQFVVESANLFVPGPGVVNGFTRVTVRPVQGRVSALELEIPPGLTVGEVSRGPVGAWRFDPQTRRLHVAVEPAQTGVFRFDVETQLGAGELPFALTLAPLRVPGATGDVGLLALAFGGDAQPEAVQATDLSGVSAQDFDATLLPRTPRRPAARDAATGLALRAGGRPRRTHDCAGGAGGAREFAAGVVVGRRPARAGGRPARGDHARRVVQAEFRAAGGSRSRGAERAGPEPVDGGAGGRAADRNPPHQRPDAR
jgi:hypothetical protein